MKSSNLNLNEVKEKSRPVLEKHNVQKAEVFGSYARGDQNEKSDIDFIVDMKEGSTLIDIAELRKDLEKVLSTQVDVLTYNSIHPEIQSSVREEAVEI